MEIAVLGGGHGSYAAAADMADMGHNVRFWRRDRDAFGPVLNSQSLTLRDRKGTREVKLGLATDDPGEALRGAELVLMLLPATAQEGMVPILAEHLTDGQAVYLAPGTFGSYLLAKRIRDAGNTADVAFGDAGTLPYLTRKQTDGTIAITTRAERLPSGIFPSRLSDHAFGLIKQAYPSVERRVDALDAALLNHGPMIHPPLILLNAGPIQHFETWDIHNEGTQPFIRAVADTLEAERIALREHFGYGDPHYPLIDHYNRGETGPTMYNPLAHDDLVDSDDWREDLDLQTHRYMREDIQLGLVMIVSLAQWAGVPAPVAHGLVSIAGAGVGEDLMKTGRTVEALGIADMSDETLRKILVDGFSS